MVHLETATHRAGDVTLVECRLESDAPRRVRVVNRLAGPVWPPRRRGVPAEGWDGNGVTVTVEGRAGVGYATPAPPADPPAAITAVEERAPAGERSSGENAFDAAVGVTSTRAGVVRDLSDPRPPRDAIPGTDPGDASGRQSLESDEAGMEEDPAPSGREGPRGHGDPAGDASASKGVGAPADEWLSAVERRIELLEAVDAATTLPEATTAVAAVGGLDALESLAGTVAADADRLSRLAGRAETLACRASATELDLEPFRRLA